MNNRHKRAIGSALIILRGRRPQPIDATASLQPLVDFGLAFESLDVAKLGARLISLECHSLSAMRLYLNSTWGLLMGLMVVFGRRS
jgi:hypothetical protein